MVYRVTKGIGSATSLLFSPNESEKNETMEGRGYIDDGVDELGNPKRRFSKRAYIKDLLLSSTNQKNEEDGACGPSNDRDVHLSTRNRSGSELKGMNVNNNTTGSNSTVCDSDQEFSANNTSIAMIAKEEAAGPSSTPSSGRSVTWYAPDPLGVAEINGQFTPNTVNQQYTKSTVAELTESRLRTLSEMLRGCISNSDNSGGRGAISSLVPGKKTATKGEVSPQFIADKMELLADVLGGLYSIPEYDSTFLTLVSSDESSNSSKIVQNTPTKVTHVKSATVNDPLSIP